MPTINVAGSENNRTVSAVNASGRDARSMDKSARISAANLPWPNAHKLWYTGGMAAKITTTDPDLKKALAAEPDEVVFLVSEQGQATHIVFPIDEARRMFDDYLRRELKIGFDQADRGQLHNWDAEDIKRRGRQRLEQESQSG